MQPDPVAYWRNILVQDFGSATMSKHIDTKRLHLGEHGLQGLSSIVIDLLDNTPLFPQYDQLRNMFGLFCGELAKKLSNVKKVSIMFLTC